MTSWILRIGQGSRWLCCTLRSRTSRHDLATVDGQPVDRYVNQSIHLRYVDGSFHQFVHSTPIPGPCHFTVLLAFPEGSLVFSTSHLVHLISKLTTTLRFRHIVESIHRFVEFLWGFTPTYSVSAKCRFILWLMWASCETVLLGCTCVFYYNYKYSNYLRSVRSVT